MAEYYPKTGVCYQHSERNKIYMIYNFSCNATCSHCLIQSNPRRRGKLDPAVATEILQQGAEYGKSFLDLSGGEIMLFPQEVLEVTRTARDLGYYVVMNTNGFWARTPEVARTTLSELKDAGMRAIFPSVSAYHLKYVPLERVKNLREACEELDVACELNWVFSDEPETDEMIKNEMGLDETYYFDGLSLVGNDEATIERLMKVYKTRVPEDIDDCLSVYLGVNPRGHVVTTCNMTNTNEKFMDSPFYLGNFYERPFSEILRAERESPVLQYIYSNPHPAMHNLLLGDDEIGEYYRDTFVTRRYFSVIEFYLDLFKDKRVMPFLERRLPELNAARAAQLTAVG